MDWLVVFFIGAGCFILGAYFSYMIYLVRPDKFKRNELVKITDGIHRGKVGRVISTWPQPTLVRLDITNPVDTENTAYGKLIDINERDLKLVGSIQEVCKK